ncbi:MAG: ribosome biogenesis GTP-binding protein YihA/YsxC [Bacteroidales bacterium]|jgi:GTP-binding protein
MEIKEVTFLKSSQKLSQCPDSDQPEYAFVGRSNVGKSSLINMLTGRRKLAKISQTPGKTTLINHYQINDDWYLVDLPGYGYAKASKAQRGQFHQLITNYAVRRENLMCLFVLVDLRIPPQSSDMDFLRFLGGEQVPFCLIFTKADKLSNPKIEKQLEVFQSALLEEWESMPHYFVTSSEDRRGRQEVLTYIQQLNANWQASE